MRFKGVFRWIATAITTALIVPFIQAPAANLASTLHFDKALSNLWSPTMLEISSFLNTLSHSTLYAAIAGAFVGFFVYAWIDYLLRSNANVEAIDEKEDWFRDVPIIYDKVFRNETVVFDGKKFARCKFYNVTIVYDGGPIYLDHNEFFGFFLKFGEGTLRTKRLMNIMHNFGLLKVQVQGFDEKGQKVKPTSEWIG